MVKSLVTPPRLLQEQPVDDLAPVPCGGKPWLDAMADGVCNLKVEAMF